MRKFEVKWTGRFPNLCSGEWIIRKNGVDMSWAIPISLKHDTMNTYGEYGKWVFNSDYEEHVINYIDGMGCKKWIKRNDFWISSICKNMDEKKELFLLIQKEDWRHGSCGGCI